MSHKLLPAEHKYSKIIVDIDNQLKPSAIWYYYTNYLVDWLKLVAAKSQNSAMFKVDMRYHVDKSEKSY